MPTNNKPTKGRGGTQNFPNAKPEPKDEETRNLYRKISSNCLQAYKMGLVRVSSDEELQERIVDFFTLCAETGQTPTVEKLALAIGYSNKTLFDWEVGNNKGFSVHTSEIIKKAKAFLSSFDADLVMSGKLNTIAYIFRAKNYYGMSDKQEVVITPNKSLGDDVDEEQIAKRLLNDTNNIVDIE